MDSVPETINLREHVKEVDGKFVLDIKNVDGWALENVGKLTTALSRERKAREDAASKVAQFESKFGEIDPDTALGAVEEVRKLREQLKNATPAEKIQAQIEQVEAQWKSRYEKDLAAERAKLATVDAQNQKLLVGSEINRAIQQAEGDPVFLGPLLERETKRVARPDGTYVTAVVDSDGAVRVNSIGENMTLDERVAEMKADRRYAKAFLGTTASGSGAEPGSTGAPSGGEPRSVSRNALASGGATLEDIVAGKVVLSD